MSLSLISHWQEKGFMENTELQKYAFKKQHWAEHSLHQLFFIIIEKVENGGEEQFLLRLAWNISLFSISDLTELRFQVSCVHMCLVLMLSHSPCLILTLMDCSHWAPLVHGFQNMNYRVGWLGFSSCDLPDSIQLASLHSLYWYANFYHCHLSPHVCLVLIIKDSTLFLIYLATLPRCQQILFPEEHPKFPARVSNHLTARKSWQSILCIICPFTSWSNPLPMSIISSGSFSLLSCLKLVFMFSYQTFILATNNYKTPYQPKATSN